MRSTLLPISLTNTDDKETVDSLSVPKPWRDKPNPRAKMTYAIVYGMIFVGIAISTLKFLSVDSGTDMFRRCPSVLPDIQERNARPTTPLSRHGRAV